jgi:hypothetical protein
MVRSSGAMRWKIFKPSPFSHAGATPVAAGTTGCVAAIVLRCRLRTGAFCSFTAPG